jgi:maltose alpha-D-glucosyltransferase/alpha-amylase
MNLDMTPLLESFPSARWFGGKGRPIKNIEVVDFGVVEDGPPALVFSILKVLFADEGPEQLYHLPLTVDDGVTSDAMDDPDRLRILGDLMAHGTSIKGHEGVFQFSGPGLDPLAPPGDSIRVMSAEQSNTSLVLDESVIVKVFRRVEVGTNPDLELTRFLTNESFEHVPLHLGEFIYEGEIDDQEISIDLGIAQRFMADSVEGWAKTLQDLDHFYGEVNDLDAREDMRFLTEERAEEIFRSIEELGEVTASLHVALSRAEGVAELTPEPIDKFDLDEWAQRAKSSLSSLMEGSAPELTGTAEAIVERIDALRSIEEPGAKLRIHGDYHLGQVLHSSRGWMILDFEGEPARSLEERRAKQSPLRDAAGLLRSLNYAAIAALFARTEPGSDDWERLEPWAEMWESVARERFLHGYLTRSHEGDFLPADREELLTMLDVFEIDKALYELAYEHGHRPDWVRIPLRGIAQVLEREPAR